ncbi:WhiB family transcriptional regulator [Streptomyces platensis]|uniref:WhiB family transcriptional regulator n=1 Tax=Streptomyces platensis TaxID=58346 RepID=UPI0036BC1C6F
MSAPASSTARPRVDASNWQHHKVCTENDFDLFMSDDPADHDEAKQICAVCPARPFCLQFALDEKADFGVFGGLGPNERLRLRGCRPRYVSDREPQWQRVLQEHRQELLRFQSLGLSGAGIGKLLGFPTQAVNRAMRELDEQAALDAAAVELEVA